MRSPRTINEPFTGEEIKSNRYKIQAVLGKGTWGTVYLVEDNLTGHQLAAKILTPEELAKEQALHRNVELDLAIRKEADFRPGRHTLPTFLQQDDQGKPFLLMPVGNCTLEQALWTHSGPLRMKTFGNDPNYPPAEERFNYALGIAKGLEEMHTDRGRAHGDIKPSNILLDDQKEPIITDFGAATYLSRSKRSTDNRDNIGYLYTRAPEQFRKEEKDTHPDQRSDIWAATSVIYYVLTGRYPLEEEIRKTVDEVRDQNNDDINERVNNFYQKLGPKGVKKIIKKKAKEVPREFRDIITEGLSYDPYKRPVDGQRLRKYVEKAIDDSSLANQLNRAMKKHLTYLGVPLVLAGILTVGGVIKMSLPESKPLAPSLRGPLYLGPTPDEIAIKFDAENMQDLPYISGGIFIDTREIDRLAYEATKDRTTGNLLAQYRRALDSTGRRFINEYQQRTWVAYKEHEAGAAPMDTYPSWEWKAAATNIEVAMKQAYTANGTVDLEDMCTIAVVGLEEVSRAKQAANSFNYKDYRDAKDKNGNYVIDRKEKAFVENWLAYLKDNRDPQTSRR